MDYVDSVSSALREDVDPGGMLLELQRLIQCYQIASADDKAVVWAALNKYAPYIDGMNE